MAGGVVSERLRRGYGLLALMSQRRIVALALIVLFVYLVVILLAPWLAPHNPDRMVIVQRLRPPSSSNLFGTDEFGRDVFSRTLHAGRISLLAGFSVVVFATLIGSLLGLMAGFFPRLDTPLARLIDAMMAFPDILLAVALVAALGPSLGTVIIALTVVYTPRIARVVRASSLIIRELPYVEAARSMGITNFRIMYRHVLRNALSPVMVQATFVFASSILAEAGLSFLGLGVNPEVATWGGMIAAGRPYLGTANWLLLFPGFVLVFAVLALLVVGDGLRDALDPRLKRLYE